MGGEGFLAIDEPGVVDVELLTPGDGGPGDFFLDEVPVRPVSVLAVVVAVVLVDEAGTPRAGDGHGSALQGFARTVAGNVRAARENLVHQADGIFRVGRVVFPVHGEAVIHLADIEGLVVEALDHGDVARLGAFGNIFRQQTESFPVRLGLTQGFRGLVRADDVGHIALGVLDAIFFVIRGDGQDVIREHGGRAHLECGRYHDVKFRPEHFLGDLRAGPATQGVAAGEDISLRVAPDGRVHLRPALFQRFAHVVRKIARQVFVLQMGFVPHFLVAAVDV